MVSPVFWFPDLVVKDWLLVPRLIPRLAPTRVQEEIMKQNTISKYWIPLHSESTIDIIKDASLLVNIRKVEEGNEMRCVTNGGF